MEKRMAQDLDKHITGHYGEDQWPNTKDADYEALLYLEKEYKFQPGDFVISLQDVVFMYGNNHYKGKTYQILEGEEDYYHIFRKDYALVGKPRC